VNQGPRLRFVQFEFAGTIGLDEGRYLARDPERVLVVRVATGAPAPRRRLRKQKPREVEPEAGRIEVPVTTVTVIEPEPLAEAAGWLDSVRGDEQAAKALVASALRLVNTAIHAARTAALDPAIADVGAAIALAVRLGYGGGEGLADGRWEEAVELPPPARPGRIEALAPQERVADVLSGRQPVDAATSAILRARADLDAGRARDAALQLRVGLEAMLADRDSFGGSRQADDLAALEARKAITGEAANEALAGALDEARTGAVEETVRICERVLRRRRAYG
jgi:hypothetical protein